MASEAHQNQEQHAANIDATQREAYEYWGYLFKPDKCGTPLLDRLLKGIADLIVSYGAFKARIAVAGPMADHATVEPQVRTQ